LTVLFPSSLRAAFAAAVAVAPLAIAALALGTTGCAKLPEGRSAIDTVAVQGTSAVDENDVTDGIATAPSPKFLGFMRGVVYDYEIFDAFALQRDLARVERLYRARGYYEAHARAGRVLTTGPGHVRVEIVVEEGAPVVTEDLRVQWNGDVPPAIQVLVLKEAARALHKGEPFDEDKFGEAEVAAKKTLTDNGYAFTKVRSDVFVDVVKHRANVVFEIDPGQPAVFGRITLLGLDPDGVGGQAQEIPEASIRRTLDLVEGAPYSTAAIESATQALLDLEIFSLVQVVPELPDPPPPTNVVPVTIKLELTKLRQVRFGGGFEFDQLKTDVHGLVGWEDHNFLGGLRDFTVDLKPGVVLYPTKIGQIVAPDRYLPEERFRLQLKQPGFLEARTNGYLRPELNTFPLLVASQTDPAEPIIGYTEFKGAAGADRTFGKFFASFGYNLQVEYPFAYKGTLDPALRTLVISYPELVARLDLRDNRIHPRSGIYLATDLQVAGGPFLGDAIDVKILPEVRTYLPLHRRIVFATRATLGFLFPSNYGDIVQNHLDPKDLLTDANRSERVRDIETVYFRGLFSGGASSNRGFPLRGIAPHGVVPFLNPSTASQQIAAKCNPTAQNPNPDPVACSIPIGGFTLWELSNEVRFSISGPFSVVTFCDMSDVSPHPANLRLDHLHLACGLGARYETPVGPIRVDIGYRIEPLQVIGYADDVKAHAADSTEGVQPRFLGQPLALALGIGEAF
jgi:outer membrane translocation and assembly module TamA